MACYHPLTAYQEPSGAITFNRSISRPIFLKELKLPCGRCIGCRLTRSRHWAMRCMHENSLHDSSCYLTLTYADEHLPQANSLHYPDFQRFMKRLRKKANKKISFYMCGEYGEEFGRPHYHALIFGYNFDFDKTFWTVRRGHKLYRSATLERLWPLGNSSIGNVTFDSASYVARYICQKRTGDEYKHHYDVCDPDTGEIFSRTPEFNRMSLKSPIGRTWFDRFCSDVYPHDYVVVKGKKMKPPRYYDRLLERLDPELLQEIKDRRELDGKSRSWDNTIDRLAVREEVATAKLNLKSRSLK